MLLLCIQDLIQKKLIIIFHSYRSPLLFFFLLKYLKQVNSDLYKKLKTKKAYLVFRIREELFGRIKETKELKMSSYQQKKGTSTFFFPLYSILKNYKNEHNNDNNNKRVEEEEEVIKKIKGLSTEEMEQIYLLIRAYEEDTTGTMVQNVLPFGGKEFKTTGLRWDLKKLPKELIGIIKNYFVVRETKNE
jgi:hypothetical protein